MKKWIYAAKQCTNVLQEATYIKNSIIGNGLNLGLGCAVTIKDKAMKKIVIWRVKFFSFVHYLRYELEILFPFVIFLLLNGLWGIPQLNSRHRSFSLKAEDVVNGNSVLSAQKGSQVILESLLQFLLRFILQLETIISL